MISQLDLTGRLFTTDSDHRFTPKHLVDVITKTLDWIVLDPCTTKSNPTGAKIYITEDEDSLQFDWCEVPTIYLNPPISSQEIFLDYLIDSFYMDESKNEFAIVAIQVENTQPCLRQLQLADLLCFPFKKVEWEYLETGVFTESITVFALYSRFTITQKLNRNSDYFDYQLRNKTRNRRSRFQQNFGKIGLVVAPQDDN